MLKKKSIVLSDTNSNSNKKAVLSLQEQETGVSGSLRLYNFSGEPSGVCSLGVSANQKIYKAGLTKKANMFYEFFLDLPKIPNKFSCAVVNFQNAVASPILYGANDGKADDVYGEIIAQMSQDNSLKNTKTVLDKYDVDFDEEEKEIIEKEVDDALCSSCDSCANCIYKKFFYEQNSKQIKPEQDLVEKTVVLKQQEETTEKFEEPKEIEPEEEPQEMFIDKLKGQIDKLFEKNPAEQNLQELIPNSKWAKIEYEDDGDFYVFGLLYDDKSQVKYVCYGVPAVYDQQAPNELSGYPIWCALDKENKEGFGYWLTYQDAITGEPVKAILD